LDANNSLFSSIAKPGHSLTNNSLSHDLNKMSTMHNSSLQHPSALLDAGSSIKTTIMTGIGKHGVPQNVLLGASPKQLTTLPRKGSRNVYMQKKGLVINHRELS
jgi:hypothetical protein